MADLCEVQKRIDYRSAPIEILEDSRLSAESRILAAWALMHGNGWQLRIAYALEKLGISRSSWSRKLKKELANAGYLIQSRNRKKSDKTNREVFCWSNVLTDDPLRFASRHDASLRFASCQIEAMQNEAITSTQVNKSSDLQKQSKQPPRAAAAASCSLEKEFKRLLTKAARSKNADRARDAAAINEARALIAKLSLDETSAALALTKCSWPSEAVAALLQTATELARQSSEKHLERAYRDSLERTNAEMRQKMQRVAS